MEFIVEEPKERLDKFLAKHIPQISRSRFQKIIESGAIKVNGHFVTKSGFQLRKHDQIVVLEEKIIAPKKEFVIEPDSSIPFEVVYEDDDIIAVNKPAGMIVHPTISQPSRTLVNGLVAKYPQIIGVGESSLRPGIVHRLDKNTSGLLIVAKNQAAFLYMKEQFLKKTIEKKYLALVEGVPKEKEGVIEYAIRPSKYTRLKKVAVKKPEEITKKSVRAAKTYYKIKKIFDEKYALVEVAPLTGRTHQIRVHMAAISHPIVGDRLYGSKTNGLKRQFLHAYFLKFKTPKGMPLALEVDLPDDLREFIDKLTAKP